jgi:Transposase DNA-binding
MPVHSDDTSWAVTACADAALGDARRTPRVIALAPVVAQRPGASRPDACGADARLQAASRCFANAAIAPQDLLDRHSGATCSRVAPVPLVVAVQETPELAGTAPPAPPAGVPAGPPRLGGCSSTPRWRSRPSGGPGAWGRSRGGPAPRTTSASGRPGNSGPWPSRTARRGRPASRPSWPPGVCVHRPGGSAGGTGKPPWTTCGPGSGLPGSRG